MREKLNHSDIADIGAFVGLPGKEGLQMSLLNGIPAGGGAGRKSSGRRWSAVRLAPCSPARARFDELTLDDLKASNAIRITPMRPPPSRLAAAKGERPSAAHEQQESSSAK